jgi:hypothetical protein
MANAETEMVTETCPKCHGDGYIAVYRNVLGGACFTCGTEGTVQLPADWRERAAQADANAKARAAKRAGAGANERLWAEFAAAHPAEAAFIERHRATDASDTRPLAVWMSSARSAVYVYNARDCQPEQALEIVRRACREFNVALGD